MAMQLTQLSNSRAKQGSRVLVPVQSRHTFLECWRAYKWLGDIGGKESGHGNPSGFSSARIPGQASQGDWLGKSPVWS